MPQPMLLARPRLGVMQTVAITTGDVALNEWVGAKLGFQLGAFVAQSLFLAFHAGDCSNGGWDGDEF